MWLVVSGYKYGIFRVNLISQAKFYDNLNFFIYFPIILCDSHSIVYGSNNVTI